MAASEGSTTVRSLSYRDSKIPLFDPNNLDCWKYAMESHFNEIGCLNIAEGKESTIKNTKGVSFKSMPWYQYYS